MSHVGFHRGLKSNLKIKLHLVLIRCLLFVRKASIQSISTGSKLYFLFSNLSSLQNPVKGFFKSQ